MHVPACPPLAVDVPAASCLTSGSGWSEELDEDGVVPHASAGVPSLALGDLEPYPFSTPSQSPLESAVRVLAHGAHYLLTPPLSHR